LVSSCGDVNHPSIVVVTYPDEEVMGSESRIVHPLLVGEEQGVPYSVTSNLVVERVKILSCEGLEDQMMALFTTIKQVNIRTAWLVLQIQVLNQPTEVTVN